MHGVNAWDWLWMIPMILLMMSAWIVPVALAVYLAIRLTHGPRGNAAGSR